MTSTMKESPVLVIHESLFSELDLEEGTVDVSKAFALKTPSAGA